MTTITERLAEALTRVVAIATEAYNEWAADNDVRVGKILLALMDPSFGLDYRSDTAEIHAVRADYEREKAEEIELHVNEPELRAASYWRQRSAEWMGRAVKLGWRDHRDACLELGLDPDAASPALRAALGHKP